MSFSPILINGSAPIVQPTKVQEYKERNDFEGIALDQTMQRNTVTSPTNPTGRKYNAELTFAQLNLSQFAQIDNLFTTGSGILYTNPNSKYGNLTYSGLPFVDDNYEYQPGESGLSDYKVRIRQI